MRTWSTPALAVICLSGAGMLGGTALLLGVLFLHNAPPNALSQQYREQLDGIVYPEFEQNWKLFAPNPLQQNVTVEARVQTIAEDGEVHIRDWVGLTARDAAAIRHNPAPSHVDQNMLRRAWDFYESTHPTEEGAPAPGQRGKLAEEYLKRIALQRFGRTAGGERILQIQFRSAAVAVPPPAWSTEQPAEPVAPQELPWWPVDEDDYRGLL
ncbi:DUF5819 family protein [Kitasatospora sp. NPDC051914]|uniref:DUF5819 family protein n=1 Tax=Kitasatospora sp. NPDC051914 TaxID=3154945 RepID=UPI003421D652